MENKDKIEIIKEILYEESTRKMLLQQEQIPVTSGSNQTSSSLWRWLAAAAVIGIVSLIGLNIFNNDHEDRALLAYNTHEFPLITKSRSAEQNIVDSYLSEINEGQYESVLPFLNVEDLTEKDKFVKALLLFRIGEHKKAKQLITSTQWTDAYHQSELDWVLYLIAYSNNESLDQLESQLSSKYLSKAKELLSK